jgi:multimeric flavodoxin WrbA
MKTVIVYSSARARGNTGTAVYKMAKDLEADVIYLDDVQFDDYSYEHRYQDQFNELLKRIIGYEHVVIASPVYWYAVTAKMKAFFDRITDFMDDDELKPYLRQWRGKRFSILLTSNSATAPHCLLEMLTNTMTYLGLSHHTTTHFDCSVS